MGTSKIILHTLKLHRYPLRVYPRRMSNTALKAISRGSDEPSALASGLVGDMSYVFFVSPDDLDGGLTPPGDV